MADAGATPPGAALDGAPPQERRIAIALSAEVAEADRGTRFQAEWAGLSAPGFVVRWAGRVHAYLNECQHVPVELDFNEGDFWDLTRQYLICATHGAYYKPDTGLCLGGPCKGRRLTRLVVEERDGTVYYLPDRR